MGPYRIGIVVGSLRKGSFNQRFADALQKLAPSDFQFTQLRIDDLPLYNQDDDINQSEPVKRLKNEIRESDAIIFVTPEYNRSVPGVLKNALDHASRPYGENAWAKKPAGVIGVSVGANGTAMAQQHLRNILAYLDMPTMGQPEAFLQMRETLFDNGNIGELSKNFVQNWMNSFVSWVKKHSSN